jgi:hypothetical protein
MYFTQSILFPCYLHIGNWQKNFKNIVLITQAIFSQKIVEAAKYIHLQITKKLNT